MDPTAAAALVPLVSRRFHSFSEAASAILDDLCGAVPGSVVLGQLRPDEQIYRVDDCRGDPIEGLQRGLAIPVAHSAAKGPSPPAPSPEQWLDEQSLHNLGLASSLTLPMEMSDGNMVGLLCALSPEADAYGPGHNALLAVAARILSYEWESVLARAELRAMREQLRDSETTDADTGLSNRDGFTQLLDREWRLAKRGTVNSMLIACKVAVESSVNGDSSPVAMLAIKDAGAALAGGVRTTDHAGRIGQQTLAAVLIGCEQAEGAEAFMQRFRQALDRITAGRQFEISLQYGYQALADAESAEEALRFAEERSGVTLAAS